MPDETSVDEPLPLPGLEGPATSNVGPLVRALHRTIAALEADGRLTEVHAFELEGIRLLARSAEMKLATHRGSTIANDMGEAFRRLDALVGDEGLTSVTEETDLMDKINAYLDGVHDARSSGSEVRDQA